MNKKFYQKVGEVLKDLRTAKGWTQVDVSKKLKINRSTYANWENGIRSIDIDTTMKICNLYQININDFTKRLKDYI